MSLPSVSVVIAAYNYERYVGEAIQSVLSQGYPEECLELVVVDDGSVDDTAGVVRGYAEMYPEVVRLVQQPNSGPEAAVSRGMSETTGELIALLDADDAWMPGKLMAQVAVLQDRPEVGLVFGDMVAVGPDGERLDRERILSQMPPLKRRAAAQVLFSNVASTSAILARRALVSQMPPGIPIADWWFTLEAAYKAEIAWIKEPIVRYRIHGGGRSAGRQGVSTQPKLGPWLRDVQFKLGAMRILDLERFSPLELVKIWEGAENSASVVIQNSGTYFAHVTALAPSDPERATELLHQADAAHARQDHVLEARLVLSALAWDPYQPGARRRLYDVAALADRGYAGPNPLAGARRLVVLADAEELLAEAGMLEAYVAVMEGAPQTSLAIDATRLPPDEAAVRLQELVATRGLGQNSEIDVLAVLGERDPIQLERMHNGTTAYYRRPLRTPGAVSASFEFTPASLPQLRELVERAAAGG